MSRVLTICMLIALVPIVARAADPALREESTIALPGVRGRFDHFAIDLKGKRLFVAALGNDTLEVVDLTSGKVTKQLTGLKEPQGVAFLPEVDRIWITNGEAATIHVFDAKTLALVAKVLTRDDPDNLRYDAATRQIYVGHGRNDGAIGVYDAAKQEKMFEIAVGGHPESFQLEPQGAKVFVNVPDLRAVVVIDRKQKSVVARWKLSDVEANYPMALDSKHGRLFVGCRKPAKLLVFDTISGKEVARLNCVGDTDDLFYDESNSRVYISGGEGAIGVVEQLDADHYRKLELETVKTRAGARTCYFAPAFSRVYLAVPQREGHAAEIRVFATAQGMRR